MKCKRHHVEEQPFISLWLDVKKIAGFSGSFNNVHMADLRQVAYSRGQNSRWAPLPCEVTRETAPDTRRAKRRPGSVETAWRAPRSQVHSSRLTQAQHTHSLVVCFCFHTIPPAAQCVQPSGLSRLCTLMDAWIQIHHLKCSVFKFVCRWSYKWTLR